VRALEAMQANPALVLPAAAPAPASSAPAPATPPQQPPASP
jgi:hypothetical protein